MRYLDFLALPIGEAARLRWLRAVVAGGYACGMLVSPRLWFGAGRSLPRAPIIELLPGFISAHDYLLSILLLIALVLSTISSRPRRYLFSVALLTMSLVLLDQTRLQPWVYQYAIILTLLACAPPGAVDGESGGPVVAANQLVVAMLYFWSGAQKLSWSFGHEVVPALLESTRIHLSPTIASYVPAAAIGVAICETLIGGALLFRKTRQAAVLSALIMHFIVLLTLVTAWRNSVVWPWNIGMMLMVMLLFRRSDRQLGRQQWRVSDRLYHLPKLVLVLCGVLPALSFAGWWDLYLSAALYSGRTPVAVMHISPGARDRFPITAQQQMFTTSRGELMLPFYEWSLSELNVPPYPEVRVYRQLARHICFFADDRQESELIVRGRPALVDGSYTVTRISCADLLALTW
jgi:hypothetical protein